MCIIVETRFECGHIKIDTEACFAVSSPQLSYMCHVEPHHVQVSEATPCLDCMLAEPSPSLTEAAEFLFAEHDIPALQELARELEIRQSQVLAEHNAAVELVGNERPSDTHTRLALAALWHELEDDRRQVVELEEYLQERKEKAEDLLQEIQALDRAEVLFCKHGLVSSELEARKLEVKLRYELTVLHNEALAEEPAEAVGLRIFARNNIGN